MRGIPNNEENPGGIINYAIEHGSSILIEKLKEKGYYPHTDLDRESVLK